METSVSDSMDGTQYKPKMAYHQATFESLYTSMAKNGIVVVLAIVEPGPFREPINLKTSLHY